MTRLTIERSAPGEYVAQRGDRTLAYIHRFQTAWIAWDALTHHALRGPFGFGGSPFRTLQDAKAFVHYQYDDALDGSES